MTTNDNNNPHETLVRLGRWRVTDHGTTYVAWCSCGWEGLPRDTRGDALREAGQHEEDAAR